MAGLMARNAYTPLDVRCPPPPEGCGAAPQQLCRSVVIRGRPQLRRPHAGRVTAARSAEARRQHPRVPAGVTDAWTCPSCGRSYWPPHEWEPELWPDLRTVLQLAHGRRHRSETTASHREGDHDGQ
jgi:hypothetical protein